MDRKDPVFITRTETFVAEDKIRPYGSWIGDFSNERLKKTISRMWNDKHANRTLKDN